MEKPMKKPTLIIIALLLLSMAQALVVETGSFRDFLYGEEPACAYDNWISHIAEGIASANYNLYAPYDRQLNGFGDFRIINALETANWNALIGLFLTESWDEAELMILAAGFPYQLVQFNDTDTGRTYYMLREIPDMAEIDDNNTADPYDDESGAFMYGWGLYVYNPQGSRPVIITVPHPTDDFATPAMGALALEVWDARFMIISGAGREVKWTNVAPFTNSKSLSDPTRVASHPFNFAYDKFADQIRSQYGLREFSAQIHSYDWNRHEGYPNNQISAGYQKLCPNLPIRDLSDLNNDMIHQAPHLVFPANTVGIHAPVYLSEYYSVNYSIHDFNWSDGVNTYPVNDYVDLPAYSQNHQMLYTLSGWNDYDSYDPFFHVEMDELPNCYEQTENNYHWFYGWDTAQQKWDYANLFGRYMQFYSPWVYHLEAVMDDMFQMNDGLTPTPPTELSVLNSSLTHITLGWQPSSAYDFDTYEVLYAPEPIGTDNYQIFNRSNNSFLASQDAQSISVTGLNNANTYYFKIRAKDKNGNYSELSNEVQSIPAPANIVSFTAHGMEQSVRLYWQVGGQTNNQGFKVYRRRGDGDFQLQDSWLSNPGLSNPTGSTFEWWDTGLQNGVVYTYRISSTNTSEMEFFHNYPVSASAMPIQTLTISNLAGTLTDSVTFGNNPYASDSQDGFWDVTKGNPTETYVWTAFWQQYWGNQGTSLLREIKGGYDVDSQVKTWVLRTRSDQLEQLSIQATGTFGRAEKLWLQDGATFHNLLSGPYSYSNANSNVRTFNLYWGNMQPRATVASMQNRILQGGNMVSFSWNYTYSFLIDHVELSLQNATDSLLVNNYLSNTQSSYSYLLPQTVDMQGAKLIVDVIAIDGVRTRFVSPYTLALVPYMNLAMLESGWQMLSNPWVTTPLSVDAVFGAGTDAYTYNPVSAWQPTTQFNFGSAVWAHLNDFVFYSSTNPLLADEYNLDLMDGWNLIGNPHLCSYDVENLRFMVNSSLYRFGEMVNQELLSPVVWAFRAGQYEPVSRIEPFQAFLIRYYGAAGLVSQINFYPFWQAPEIDAPSAQSSVTLHAAVNGLSDWVRVGTHNLANDASDFRLNLAKPPVPPFSAPRLYVPELLPTLRPDGQLHSQFLPLLDANGASQDVIAFNVRLELPTADPVTISWGDNGLPDGWQAAFLIEDEIYHMGSAPEFVWQPDQAGTFNANIRLSNYAVANQDQVAFLLGKPLAWPNPFNPDVNIAFSLAAPANLSADVYNLRGQKVRSLCNGPLSGGNHTLHWNGRDSGGSSVASGIYFVKLSTGKHNQVIKVMLMK